MNPTVSVVMANYNTRIEYLKEAIDSILNQTFSDFEFIIVDDCSSDDSYEFVKTYTDERIVLLRNEHNLGLTKSLNIGFSYANGKYIARMDSDDISLPERFEKQVRFMDENPDLIVSGTWFEKFGVENKIRRPVISDFELYRCQLVFSDTPITLCHPSAIFRKSLLDEFSIKYDESILKSQDYAMWAECSKHARIDILNEVLLRYRTHEKQISVSDCATQADYSLIVCKNQLSELGVSADENLADFRNCHITSVSKARDFFSFINSILDANEKKGIYSQEHLETYTNLMIERVVKNKEVNILLLFFFAGKPYRRSIYRIIKRKFSNEH